MATTTKRRTCATCGTLTENPRYLRGDGGRWWSCRPCADGAAEAAEARQTLAEKVTVTAVDYDRLDATVRSLLRSADGKVCRALGLTLDDLTGEALDGWLAYLGRLADRGQLAAAEASGQYPYGKAPRSRSAVTRYVAKNAVRNAVRRAVAGERSAGLLTTDDEGTRSAVLASAFDGRGDSTPAELRARLTADGDALDAGTLAMLAEADARRLTAADRLAGPTYAVVAQGGARQALVKAAERYVAEAPAAVIGRGLAEASGVRSAATAARLALGQRRSEARAFRATASAVSVALAERSAEAAARVAEAEAAERTLRSVRARRS